MDSIKEQSIDRLFRKYSFKVEHAEQVKKLSLLIFDKTQGSLHNFSNYERDLLEAGALLHDIGHFISNLEHNKYSYILITQEKLEGFTPEEVEIIGNIARYHRGKHPKKYHNCYAKLPDKNAKKLTKKLSAILRIADGLDKSQRSAINNLDCLYDSFSKTLYIVLDTVKPDLSLEFTSTEEKKILFEKEFKVQVEFKQQSCTNKLINLDINT